MKHTRFCVVLLLSLLLLTACGRTEIVGGAHSEHGGVYLTLDAVYDVTENERHLEVTWHNGSEREIIYGKRYAIEYKTENGWESVLATEFEVEEIAYVLTAGGTAVHRYSTLYFDLSKTGRYRLSVSFTAPDSETGHTLWVEFDVVAAKA